MDIYIKEEALSGTIENTTVEKKKMVLFVIARRVILRNCN